jgi:hypothetical protein
MSISKTVVVVQSLPPDHPHAFGDYDWPGRPPLQEERNLLVLLEAARLAAFKVIEVHDGDSALSCDCEACRAAT